jgi:hypothetical protein
MARSQLQPATTVGDKLVFKAGGIVNRFLKSLLRLGLDLVEQSERTGRALRRQQDHTVRNVIIWKNPWRRCKSSGPLLPGKEACNGNAG